MSGAQRARLADGRWHFQHGPIDCILGADGDPAAIARAVERAWARFGGILAELVDELPLLRTDLASAEGAAVRPRGPIARRMVAACRAHATNGRFITAMAAVAGSVAEELIDAFDDPRIARAYVNNGGDIALHLADGQHFTVGLADRPDAPGLMRTMIIDSNDPTRGVATSGRHGRSFSLGIADAVTVLAPTASQADAAATIIANAVDLPGHPAIVRCPAHDLQPDSDLGERLVTRGVGELSASEIEDALEAGAACARRLLAAGLIDGAALRLHGEIIVVTVRGIEMPGSQAPLGRSAMEGIMHVQDH